MEQVGLYDIVNYAAICRPRRVMRYVLIYCSEGQIEVEVDDNHFVLTSNAVITITSGQIHTVTRLADAAGQVLEFTYDFSCQSDQDIELVFHNSLFCHFGQNEVVSLNESSVLIKLLNDQRPYC